jgi:hypothetical protein
MIGAMHMKKKVLTGCLVVFLGAMLIAYIVAENVYYNALPEIVVGQPREAHLRESYPVTPMVMYGKSHY